MSTEITRFNNDVKASTAMQEEIKALGVYEVIAYAKAKGYQFSEEDVTKAVNDAKTDQNLSDESLDNVAGGTMVIAVVTLNGGGDVPVIVLGPGGGMQVAVTGR